MSTTKTVFDILVTDDQRAARLSDLYKQVADAKQRHRQAASDHANALVELEAGTALAQRFGLGGGIDPLLLLDGQRDKSDKSDTVEGYELTAKN